MVVHLDGAALLSEGEGESDLPIESVRRLCCDGSVISIHTDALGEPLNVGRKQRTVPTTIRRALIARDRTCTFPGCTHGRWLDAHHIKYWADGGETSLDNLILLCSHHHRLVHEGGFTVATRRDGSRCFARPDGRPVEVAMSTANTGNHTQETGDEQTNEIREPIAPYLITSSFTFRGKSPR